MTRLLPPLLRPLHSDEYLPVRPHRALDRATDAVARKVPELAGAVALDAPTYAHDRRATALALLEIDAAHGGGFYVIDPAAARDADAAAAAFGARGPVVDVQTHLVDPALWHGPHAAALGGFLKLVDPARWSDPIDPHGIDAAAWAALVFGASETAVALLTSTPGPSGENVLENAQIAAVRDVTDRYAGTGRVLTHTIVHPNLGPAELDRMGEWSRVLSPSAWKVYTLAGPPTAASPTGGWFLDDAEIGLPFLERVRELGPRIVCAHKGLGGPVPDASVAAASPRDIGPAAAAFGDVAFVVYHSGYERDPFGAEGAFDPITPSGVDRLVASVRAHDIGPGGNVYAELGSTWFLVLRRPVEAAHVLGKLLAQFGPERILWGTDSTWYGSPQPLIDAFRAFTIPERMQEEFGYPPLTDAVKTRILGANASELYGLEPPATPVAPDQASVLAPRLLAALDAARA
jgi:predicted TIM-barrel fold metal-dependent hydrolase